MCLGRADHLMGLLSILLRNLRLFQVGLCLMEFDHLFALYPRMIALEFWLLGDRGLMSSQLRLTLTKLKT